jgi:DNA-binding transcriptional ArsR family regulator
VDAAQEAWAHGLGHASCQVPNRGIAKPPKPGIDILTLVLSLFYVRNSWFGSLVVRRRIPGSLALLVVVTSLGVAAAGFTAQGTESGSVWSVPAPRSGDQGSYQSAVGILSFEFTEGILLMPDGTDTARLSVLFSHSGRPAPYFPNSSPGLLVSRHWLDGADVVASMGLVGSEFSGTVVAGMPRAEADLYGYSEIYAIEFEDPEPSYCGLVHTLQGHWTNGGPGQTLESPGCATPVSFAGWNETGEGARYSSGSTSLVLDARLPVPMIIEVGGLVWELSEFEAGTHDFLPWTGAQRPALVWTPGLYPDETGVAHPFPLSAALEQAMLQDVDFARAMGYPDAYVAEASYVEKVEHGAVRRVWTLTAKNSGQVAGEAEVTFLQAQSGDPLPSQAIPLAAYVSSLPTDAPSAKQFPKNHAPRFPSLGDLIGHWETTIPVGWQADPANAWGFFFDCEAACTSDDVRVWVGTNTQVENGALDARSVVCRLRCLDLGGYYLKHDVLVMDGQGYTTQLRHSFWRTANEVGSAAFDTPAARNARGPGTLWTDGSAARDPAWLLPAAGTVAGVTALGLLTAALYQFWPALKAGLVGLLRSGEAPAAHPTRKKILDAVAASPGIHFQEIARRTGLALGTLRHHLRVLTESGKLTAVAQGGYRSFFLSRGTSRDVLATAGVLKAPAARTMLHGIVKAGHLSMGEVATLAGLRPATATHHVERLEAAGLVRRQRSGRTIEVHPTPAALLAVAATVAAT